MKSIIFLSYDEYNADENWRKLQQRFPRAKRIHGISGILEAHRACAALSESEHFFLVDGDNEVFESFSFEFNVQPENQDAVHVWRCKNAVNDLIYGYGAIKLYSRSLLFRNQKGIDLATSASNNYVVVEELASVTNFNTSPLSSWRSAFRECVKLSSEMIRGQNSQKTRERLDSWCALGEDRVNGTWCMAGANAGRKYGLEMRQNISALAKINDFYWLSSEFEKYRDGNKGFRS